MCPNQDEEVISDPVMTAKEVAQYLRLTEATIYRLAKEGDIPGAKVGRVWRFKRSLIEKWLQDESLQPTA